MDTKPSQSNGRVGELVHRITDDVKLIARDEVELARQELQHTAKVAASEAAVILLGAIVALVGLGMLCVVAVVALAPVIHPLWARLLIMSIVYLAIGGALAATFAKRLKTDIVPDLKPASYEARRTLAGVKSTLSTTAS
jgi:hypothetical protein